MAMGSEIAAYLVTLGLGSLVAPRTLFINIMPEDPDVCGAVYETGGSAPDGGFGVEGIQYENPTCAIRFRGVSKDSEGPRIKARLAYRELAKIQAETVGACAYLTVTPLQAPFITERELDGKQRVVWGFSVLAQKEYS